MNTVESFKKILPITHKLLIQKKSYGDLLKTGVKLSSKYSAMDLGIVVNKGEGLFNISGNTKPISVPVGSAVLLSEKGGSRLELGEDIYYLYSDSEIEKILS